MNIRKMITNRGSKFNEDNLAFGENWFIVLDGASGLGDNLISDTSDAQLFVKEIVEYIEDNYGTFTGKKILEQAVNHVNTKYQEYSFDNVTEPSAGFSFVEVNEETVDIFYLGDVETYVYKTNGSIDIVRDMALPKLDAIALNKVDELKGTGSTLLEKRAYADEIIKINRAKKNSDSYLTDEEFADFVKTADFTELVNNLRKLEESDLDGEKVTRFKLMDDATAMFVNL